MGPSTDEKRRAPEERAMRAEPVAYLHDFRPLTVGAVERDHR